MGCLGGSISWAPNSLIFGLGYDLRVREFEPSIKPCNDSAEPAWDSFSLPLSVPPQLVLSLSLKINKLKKQHFKVKRKEGLPGWLSQLSVQLRFRSYLTVREFEPSVRALCWHLRAWNLLWILCLPLCHFPVHTLFVSL